jgi:predicted DNA binding CopG/RHH family protein
MPLLSWKRKNYSYYIRPQSGQTRTKAIWEILMKKQYDFSKSTKNPYAKKLKKQVTLRLGIDVIEYFKELAQETGIPYQNLINLYLKECANSRKKLTLKWAV